MSETIEEVLAHYGVRGMKWGVRKRSSGESSGPTPVVVKTKPGVGIKTSGGKGHPASDDAIKAATARQKAKKSGAHSLSNAEMKSLVERMNLESQYSKLTATEPRLAQGKKFVQGALGSKPAELGLEFAKHKLADTDDVRVKNGLRVAEFLVSSQQSGKKKKK